MYTARPKPLAAPARSTTPSPAAYSGVRIGAARSIPQWKVPHREQKQLVYRAPWIGRTNLGRAAPPAAGPGGALGPRPTRTGRRALLQPCLRLRDGDGRLRLHLDALVTGQERLLRGQH